MRDSGLAHILSISGLHIVFVVGLVMGLVRYGIALVPPLALRDRRQEDRRRRWRSLAALFYTALAGAPVPAQRACAMAGFALLAVAARPHGAVAAAGRLVGGHRADRRARVADRRLVPDVVRRRRRPDRGLGGGRAAGGGACTSAPSSRAIAGCGGSVAAFARQPRHDADRLDRDRRLRRLPLQPAVAARRRRQPAGRAAHRLLDHAVGPAWPCC